MVRCRVSYLTVGERSPLDPGNPRFRDTVNRFDSQVLSSESREYC